MGIYDRDYYREEPKGFLLGGSQSVVTTLILLNGAIFLADWIVAGGAIAEFLSLKRDIARHPWDAWQLVSYGFVHDTKGIIHVFFNMFGLWMFGRDVEIIYGRREFLALYITLLIVAGACWLAVENLIFPAAGNLPVGDERVPRVIGASGAVVGVLVLYVWHHPKRTIHVFGVLPVPAWLFALVLILSDVLGMQMVLSGQDTQSNIAYATHLAGAAWGSLYYRTRWSLGRLIPGRLSWKSKRPRPNLRVHDPEPDDQESLNERVDKILEKIHQSGEASLTREERRTLEEASRRFQQRKR